MCTSTDVGGAVRGNVESIPDGPLTAALSTGHARLIRARAAAGMPAPSRGRDPWTIARNRRRMGVVCGKPPAFMPMFAAEPAPCSRRPPAIAGTPPSPRHGPLVAEAPIPARI